MWYLFVKELVKTKGTAGILICWTLLVDFYDMPAAIGDRDISGSNETPRTTQPMTQWLIWISVGFKCKFKPYFLFQIPTA